MKMKITPMDTTVPGSFPVFPFYEVKWDYPPYTDEVPDGEPYVDNPFVSAVFEALTLQKRVGIDYPTYGQPQDMCSMFLGCLLGRGLEYDNGFQVVGDIEVPDVTPALEYLQVAKRYFHFKGVKMPVTGPVTLAATVKVGKKAALEYTEIVAKLAEVVSHIVCRYDEGGASIICVDEPSLTYALYVGLEPEFLIEVINTSLEKIRQSVPSIHVCGQLNTVITDIVSSTKAVILDHEFASIPGNVPMYSRDSLESYEKMVGYGCVVSNMEPGLLVEIQKDGDWQRVVEPVDVIKKRILEAVDQFGRDNIILDPDCGFGGLRRYVKGKLTKEVALNICYEKLKHMVEARKEIV